MLMSISENLKNFNIYEKSFSSGSEIIQKLYIKNFLFQRFGQSINKQNTDQPQKSNEIDSTRQPVQCTSSNLDYIILG